MPIIQLDIRRMKGLQSYNRLWDIWGKHGRVAGL